MDSATEQILTAALDLPDPDRLELLEALIDSFQASDPIPFDDSWREVVQRRSAELKSGQVDGARKPRIASKRKSNVFSPRSPPIRICSPNSTKPIVSPCSGDSPLA
jgi:putative addiction module component (TIGR02574 family)